MTAINHRKGSTLSPELRKGWEGARLGFTYADPHKRLPIAAHSYRFCLLVGVQPGRAGALLDDSDGGTPQRFVWLPTIDPDAPDELPAAPKPITWTTPLLPDADAFQDGMRIIAVCGEAEQAIRAERRTQLRGVDGALGAHALLCRLKLSVALALLDGHCGVRAEDWRLAGMLMDVSDATRGAIVETLQRKERAANLARGHAEAERDAVRSDRAADEQLRRACQSLRRRLEREGDWMTGAELRRDAGRRARDVFDEAVESLLQAGQIDVESIAGQGRSGRRIRLSAGGR
jgi:hypothetical protein